MTSITKPIEIPRFIPDKVDGHYEIWDTWKHVYYRSDHNLKRIVYIFREEAVAEAKKLNEQTK